MAKIGFFAQDARAKMREFGLTDWRFELGSATRTHGCTVYRTKTIRMSRIFIEHNSEEACMNVLLHEIAHALVGPRHHHDAVWQAKALEIGCDGRRTVRSNVRVEKAWIVECTECRMASKSGRRNTRLICAKCYNNTGREVYLKWTRNPLAGTVVQRTA